MTEHFAHRHCAHCMDCLPKGSTDTFCTICVALSRRAFRNG